MRLPTTSIIRFAAASCVALVACMFSASSASAGWVGSFFVNGSTSASGGHPLSANAQFAIDADADTIQVTLWNLQADPTAAGQLLTGAVFNIRENGVDLGDPAGANTIVSQIGTLRTVNSNGTWSDGGSTNELGWGFSYDSGAGGFLLNGLDNTGIPQERASRQIIGPAGTGDLYNNANPSVTGGSHNPHLAIVASWTLSGFGDLTENSRIANGVLFRFNTDGSIVRESQTIYEDSITSSVPEPASMLLFGLTFVGGGLGLRCRRHQRKQNA